MDAGAIQNAATAIIALDAGFLGVVITLVALLPALTEAALKGTSSEYERAVRGVSIERELLGLRLLIPLLAVAICACGVTWALRDKTALIVTVVISVAGLGWLSYVAYVISRHLGRFLIKHDSG